MGFKIDITNDEFDMPAEYFVKFDGDVPVDLKMFGYVNMEFGITRSRETNLEFYLDSNSLGKTSLFVPIRGSSIEPKKENTIPREYLDCVMSHLDKIQNDSGVGKNSGYGEIYHELTRYVSTLMDFYQSEKISSPLEH